jgi:hypothetical protein
MSIISYQIPKNPGFAVYLARNTWPPQVIRKVARFLLPGGQAKSKECAMILKTNQISENKTKAVIFATSISAVRPVGKK